MSVVKTFFTMVGITLIPYSLCSQNKNSISFSVEPGTGQAVIIQWKISDVNDTLRFEVERSKDTIRWETISQISTQSAQLFSFEDRMPGSGLIYYRIKQISNGVSSYSTIKWVQISKTGNLYLWPNPARDMLHVRTPFANGSIDIMDEQGKFMLKKAITNNITDVPMQQLAKGIYLIRVKHDKEILVEKFVKE